MDLHQCFIEPESEINPRERQNASYLRRVFMTEREVESARLQITACGVYKAYINGRAIDHQVFLPGFTYYRKRLQFQEYDVTSLLQPGENVIAVVLGDGWYRGQIGAASKMNVYGEKTKLAAVLDIAYSDGSLESVTTDARWKATQDGPIRHNDLKGGECYDAGKEMPGWNAPGFDDQAWHQTWPSSYAGNLVASEGERILEHETFTPDVLQTPDGSTVLDFRQNIFGYVAFRAAGDPGRIIKLHHGETLDENKNFTIKNLTINKFQKTRSFQVITCVLGAERLSYKPTFSAHGFRYVKLENWPGEVVPEDFQAIAVYSAMRQTGDFQCSNPLINQLVANTRWSQKGNFLDIPTDCPTRERAGWTGDIAAFCEAGTYLMDIRKFLAKWLRDLAAQQKEDGCVASIVPDVSLGIGDGSAGWADASIIVPYVLYQVYGDPAILNEQYQSMQRWMQFMQNRARKTSIFHLLQNNPHKDHIIDTGFHFGEWLEPGHSMILDSLKAFVIADSEVATAYYAWSARLMSEIAAILGKKDDAAQYEQLHQQIKAAYRYTFTDQGVIRSDRQCRYVRPIAFDFLSEEEKQKNAAMLNQMIIKNRYRIGTGFLTTQSILTVLTEHGYSETAYRMLENTEKPSWLYNVKKGATTILEDWEGISEEGVPKNSFNHYAFGTVVKWLFASVAGITALQPGYRAIRIKPVPGGSLHFARASFDSPAGLIVSEWKIEQNTFVLNVELPAAGEIHLPDGRIHPAEAGSHSFTCPI
jgi:alpha-L-rhamnosidase